MKVGISLSGGGIRGVSHLGVIKALEESGYEIEIISGTSAGAVIGAFYASGYTPEETLKIIGSRSFLRLLRPKLNSKGLMSMEGFGKELSRYLPHDNFESLKIPVIVAATELKSGRIKYFDSGPLIRPLLASSCIPVLFFPVNYENNDYVDGGIISNLPSYCIRDKCSTLVGISCNPISQDFNPKNFRSMLERTFLLSIKANVDKSKAICDLFIEPELLSSYSVMDISKATQIFKIGYEYALQMMDKFNTNVKD